MDLSHLDKTYEHLVSGNCYRIAKSFEDYDQNLRTEGHILEFLGSSFLPYEDGLSLFFRANGSTEQIRLHLRREDHLDIANSLEQYFCEA
jgi:hypothetical protein